MNFFIKFLDINWEEGYDFKISRNKNYLRRLFFFFGLTELGSYYLLFYMLF